MLTGITIIAVVVAVSSTVVAWRVVRQERRRSDARVAALAREIHGTSEFDLDLKPAARTQRRNAAESERTASVSTQRMFAAAPARSGSRLGLALAIGGFAAASIGAAAIVLGGASTTAPAADDRPSRAAGPAEGGPGSSAGPAAAAPLELITLAHERQGDTLTVRGTVLNPLHGTEMVRLTAVVFVFDANGGFLASGRAPVDSPELIPGGESAFAVTIPGAGDVARYRVSFRSGDRIVSHIDKRTMP